MIISSRRVWTLIVIMAAVGLVTAIVTLHILYQAAFWQERDRLVELVQSQARFMEAVARYDQANADLILDEHPNHDPVDATLSQIRDGLNAEGVLQGTVEFTVARREGAEIVFLLRNRHADMAVPAPVSIDAADAEPMRRALAGESGWLIGLDYRGERVLAAHEPVALLGVGVVAKIDLAEIRAPFIRAGLAALATGMVILIVGGVLIFRIGKPLVTALERHEIYHRSLLESLHEDVLVIDPKYRIVDMNNPTMLSTGLSRENVIGRHCFEVSHGYNTPCDEHGEECALRKVFATGEPTSCIHEHRCSDGSMVHIDILLSPVRDERGNITNVIEAVRDITDIVKAQSATRESEATARALLNATHDAAQLLDLNGVILDVNEAITEWMGLPREEIIGTCVFDLFSPASIDARRAVFDRVIQTGEAMQINDQSRGRNLHTILYPLRNVSGQVTRVAVFIQDVTERLQAEEALRRERDRAETYLRVASALFVSLDSDGRVSMINPRGCEILGWSEEEIIGKDWFENFLPESSRDEVRAMYGKLMAGELEMEEYIENPILTASGEERLIAWHNSLLRDREDRISGGLAFGVDITEQRRAEKILQESQAQIASAQRLAHLGRWEWDVKTGDVIWSDEVYRIFGVEPESFCPCIETIAPFYHPEDPNHFTDVMERAKEPGYEHTFQARIFRPDGDMRHFFSTSEGVHDEDGNLITIFGTVQDVTDLKRTQEALLESEERFRAVFEQAGDSVFLHDGEGHIVDVNRAACERLGYTREELLSLSVSDVDPDAEGRDDMEEIWPRILKGQNATFEARHRRRDGSEFPVEVTLGLVRLQGDQLVLALVRDITERRRAEQALRESEERFRAIFEQAAVGVARIETQTGRFLEVNQRYCEIVGLRPEEMTARSFTDITHPDDLQADLENVERLRAGEIESFTMDKRYLRPDGSVVWVTLTVSPMWGDGETPECHIAVVEDISQRKRAEQALRDERDFSGTLLESLPGIFYVIDANGYVRRWNRNFEILSGYSGEEIRPMKALDFIAEEDRDQVDERIRMVFSIGASTVTADFQSKDGHRIPFLFTGVLTDIGGEPLMVGMGIDVSERKRIEEERDRFFNLSADMLCVAEIEGHFKQINPAWERVLGWSRDELMAKPYLDFVHPDDRDSTLGARAELIDGQPIYSFENRYLCRDGSYRLLSWNSVPLPDSGLVFAVARDMTEQRRAEEERRDLEEKIQQAQKLESLGVLAGGIAHDFNNLLMGILGNASLAMDEMSPEAPARSSLEQIEVAARRAAELTKQMLAYSGKGRFVIKLLDLSSMVEEMMHMLKVSISKKAVLRLNLERNLPAIKGDPTQIRQIIMNLITNASEAIGDRSGIISITTGAMECDREYLDNAFLREGLEEGLYITLEVSDTGCGMDEETRQKIFDPFFTTKFTGRGLGLAAVMGIVRGHRGALKVYSEPNQGSSFRILFPATDKVAEESGIQRTPSSDWRGSGTILVADDEETVRSLAKRILTRAGFEVLIAEHGRMAVEIYAERFQDISLVLLDMTMPHMDGDQVFREMRRIQPDVRVILTSGYNQQDATQRFAGKGLAGFIQKPYAPADLIEKVREALGAK